ncbi:lipoprotein [Spiroplasma endosymbiont of Diplazon laetatorius]|uniref:lipoprotein n=1 Tax=Spiroplasma endosymbiont of Diplazon laetatorius TaxID=3066322 RepID=UPI0030D22BEC
MRKLLSVISVTALVGTSSLSVVSCSSNKYFKEFKGWIDNKESFILYMGADDCEYCQGFEYLQEKESSYFKTKTKELNTNYNQEIKGLNGNYSDSMTAFGEKLNNDLEFRTMKTEEKANKFDEKWSKNILSWLVDEVTEVYKYREYNNSQLSDKLVTKLAKAKVETYLKKDNLGIPFFLVIRNGKVAGWYSGFSKEPEAGWNELVIDELFKQLNSIITNHDQETEMVNLVNNGQSTGGESGSGEGSGTGGQSGGEEGSNPESGETFSYVMNKNSLLIDYLMNK